jgi:poly(A) polymerase
VLKRWKEREAAGSHRIPALDEAIDDVLAQQTEKLAIQRRFVADMREIWMMQPRFERRTGRSPYGLLEHLRLRAGYDFLALRCAADEAPAEMIDWWTRFMDGNEEHRAQLTAAAPRAAQAGGARRRRRRRPRGMAGETAGTQGEGA